MTKFSSVFSDIAASKVLNNIDRDSHDRILMKTLRGEGDY
jgi:hypothetical protein